MRARVLMTLPALLLILSGALAGFIPSEGTGALLTGAGVLIFLLSHAWKLRQNREQAGFANEICDTIDALMEGRKPENYEPYEDSRLSKVQGKLVAYSDAVQEGIRQVEEQRQTIQELVSDISHQVKTPIANIRMFADIVQGHRLPQEKQDEFLKTVTSQIDKLDFLLQSLIKMSRLETGTFALHMEKGSLYSTLAEAVNGIWARAEQKKIRISLECGRNIVLCHDAKWTAEALGNILENAVKYTPEGGAVRVSVIPWQFYTRIDIADTGIGISGEHYHDVFRRFYRGREAAGEEGLGLGLYLARDIIMRQKGYITVQSEEGEGTTFSVFLPD